MRQLLAHLLEDRKVRGLSMDRVLAHIYQYDKEEMHASQQGVEDLAGRWKAITAGAQGVETSKPTAVESTLVRFFKAFLTPGHIFCAPSLLPALPASPTPSDSASVVGTLAKIHDRPPVTSDMADYMYFSVVNPNPHRRVVRGQQSFDFASLQIQQHTPTEVVSGASGRVSTQAEATITTLNIRTWLTQEGFEAMWSSLRKFQAVRSLPSIAPVRPSDEVVSALPAIDDEASLSAVAFTLSPADSMRALVAAADLFPSGGIPIQHLLDQGVGPGYLDFLGALGAIEAFQDDFGERALTLQWEKYRWDVIKVCEEGGLLGNCEPEAVTLQGISKLQACLYLLRQGWSASADMPPALSSDSPRVFPSANLQRSKLYWFAMLGVDGMFGKGVDRVPHNKPEYLYACLLSLAEALM